MELLNTILNTNKKDVFKKQLLIEKKRDIKLYVRPPRTLEYIQISFTILPTGEIRVSGAGTSINNLGIDSGGKIYYDSPEEDDDDDELDIF